MSDVTQLNSNSSNLPQKFEYNSLHTETSSFVLQQTEEIRALVKRAAQDIALVGQKLIDVKAKLGHGNFLHWLKTEFQWSWDTAKRLMRVAEVFGENQQFADFHLAPSVLYMLAAPSTPKAAREEALALAEKGERITYKVAKALKQKYGTVPETDKPKKSQAIVARPEKIGSASSSWWQLGGKHLLYCGEPDSPEFLGYVGQEARLLLSFPPSPTWRSLMQTWQPKLPYKTLFATSEYLPKNKNLTQLDAVLESNILFYTDLWSTVVICFLPSPEILSIVNRLDRYGIVVEPDAKRCSAAIADWKGLKVERR